MKKLVVIAAAMLVVTVTGCSSGTSDPVAPEGSGVTEMQIDADSNS